MTGIETIATVISAAGTVLSTVGAIQQGNAARKSANFEAQQLEMNAKSERASAQRAAFEKRREARLAASRAKALAAAGGGSVTDPTVTNLLGDIASEGEYNAAAALYAGEERAKTNQMAASARRFEGQQAKNASTILAGSTVLSSGASLMDKYAPRRSMLNA